MTFASLKVAVLRCVRFDEEIPLARIAVRVAGATGVDDLDASRIRKAVRELVATGALVARPDVRSRRTRYLVSRAVRP